jgi:hypothetical protein
LQNTTISTNIKSISTAVAALVEENMAEEDGRAEGRTNQSSITADTGTIAAQPILEASPKHMAKYEHSPHSETDRKYQRSPQN